MSRKGKCQTWARSKHVSPRRTRSSSHQEDEPLDHELELESLIQLNLDAASGELPSQQALDDQHRQTVSNPTEPATTSTQGPFTAAVLPTRSAPNPEHGVAVRKRRQQQVVAQKVHHADPLAGFSDFLSGEENPDDEPVILRQRTQRDDQDALNALVGSFQPFITPDEDPLALDRAFPLAFPIPVTGVAEQSALREFRNSMIDRHKECEVPLPSSDNLTRFFAQLPEGRGIHLQLPALAFPTLPKDPRSEGQFRLVGSLVLDRMTGDAQVVSINTNRQLSFVISQQNVPSLMSEVFLFNSVRNDTETGTVKLQTVELTASLAGSMKFVESQTDDDSLSVRRDAELEKVASEKMVVLERNMDRKRTAETTVAETDSAKDSSVAPVAVPTTAKRPRRNTTRNANSVPVETVAVTAR